MFPHEVSDIERVLVLLEDTERAESWHSKFILLLWLSILCLIPFDLTRLDGDNEAGYSVKRMLNLAKVRILLYLYSLLNASRFSCLSFFDILIMVSILSCTVKQYSFVSEKFGRS